MKKTIILLMTIILITSTITYANTTDLVSDLIPDLIPIDAVLILDVSLSMRTADPNRISRMAMNMFIDMLEDHHRVGIVAYAGRVERSLPLIPVYENRENLHEFINSLEYASWTDHGLGLMEAVQILYYGTEPGRQTIIIFFTDGNLNVNTNTERSNEIAQSDVDLAISIAQQQYYPIFSIGLNFDGSLDLPYIQRISDETGGLTFITENATQLPDIMFTIFNEMLALPPPLPAPSPIEIEIKTESEVEPEIIPTIDIIDTELSQNETEITEMRTTEQDSNNNIIWLIGGAIVLVVVLLYIWLRFKKPRRVFTGRLVLEVIDNVNNQTTEPQYRNLIEYGKSATLQKLLGGKSTLLETVELIPSPDAPSHMPQLLVKSKNPQLTFTKDFLEFDATKGISIGLGAEMTIVYEDKKILLRYIN